MYLVLFETSGNQRFIFQSNKLRENVGASQLTYLAGTKYVLQAVEAAGGPKLWDYDPSKLRSRLTDRDVNQPIGPGVIAEVILATSGKALLLVDTELTAQRMIRDVTSRALTEAAGLEIRGVFCAADEMPMGRAVTHAHHLLEQLNGRMPGAEARFARLPIIDECATSGFPANCLDPGSDGSIEARSNVSFHKRTEAENGFERMKGIVRRATAEAGRPFELYDSVADLEKKFDRLDWLAVIHADGNGLGRIFLEFEKFSSLVDPRIYVDSLRSFSIGIEVCTERAFATALAKLGERLERRPGIQARQVGTKTIRLPVVPLVLGGDDFTIICAGREALELTHDYLRAFEQETGNRNGPTGDIVPRIATLASGGIGRLSCCAGVAIVKPHYPFHAAYELADDLIDSAKTVKEKVKPRASSDGTFPCSALDFLIHHDTSGSDLESIRDRLIVGDSNLYTRPYAVTDLASVADEKPAGREWIIDHHWSGLVNQILAIKARGDDGRRKLPSSMLHDLRDALFHGPEFANGRLGLVFDRYRERGLDRLAVPGDDSPSLFSKANGESETCFLDAMDASEFLSGSD